MTYLIEWYLIFAAISAGFVFCLRDKKSRKRYLAYAFFGSMFGFFADLVSFLNGYYSYPYYPVTVMGLPFSMTIAEGFSAAITIRVAAESRKILELLLLKKREVNIKP